MWDTCSPPLLLTCLCTCLSARRFAKLVAGRQPDELALVVQRIRAFNAADLATDSKRKLQVRAGSRRARAYVPVLSCHC